MPRTVKMLVMGALLLLAAVAGAAQDQAEPTRATGSAPEASANYKKAALQEAFRSAVHNAIGAQVNSETVVRESALLKDKIIVKSDGYVKKYEILDERTGGGDYEVTIKAWVSATELNKDLFLNGINVDQVYDWAGKPRLMVLMTDLIDGQVSPTPFIRNEMEGLFRSKGITVIDHRQLGEIKQRDIQLALNDPQKAVALGNRFGAEIVIVGKSVSNFSRELDVAGFRQYFYTTQLDAKAYRTSTAEVLLSQVYADGQDADTSAMGKHDAAVRSVRQVVGKNAGDIVFRVVKSWYQGMAKANSYQVIVSKLKGSELSALVKSLGQNPSVIQVHRRSFNSGTAEIEIEYDGIQGSLVELLETNGVVPLALVSEEPYRISLEKEK